MQKSTKLTVAEAEDLRRENEGLRESLFRLSEACLRLSQSLDPEAVLQGVIESARSLTEARYGALLTFGASGEIETLITSGMTLEERGRLGDLPKGRGLLRHLNEMGEPLRLANIASHPNSVGFPEGHPPMRAFLGTPVLHLGERLGNIYLTEKEGGREFTLEDEQILVMFASQAAAVINNVRLYMEERRAKADLEALIENSPVGVLLFDAKTENLLSFNAEVRRICGGMSGRGRSREQLHDLFTLRHMDGREVSFDQRPVSRVLRTGEKVFAEELVVDFTDRESVTVVVNAIPVRSEEGEISSVLVTLQDMTPLEQVERQRTEFLAMVSHELRTPLTTIKGSAATLLGASSLLDPEEMRQFFQIIDDQADHMRGLIGDLLDVNRIETGMLSVNPENLDLSALAERTRNVFLNGGAKNVIEVDAAPDLPLVRADSQRITQVLSNLLANASKYSPDWSTIKVSLSPDDMYVAVSVTDEGRGISGDRLPRLFSKFTRFEGEDSDQRMRGHGLGLAICRGIVEAHGGRIWAESAGPGLGTRFTFTIPAAGEAVAGSGDPGPASRNRARILVVDDEVQILRMVRNTLSQAGYTPTVTSVPEDVERLVETESPHLVLMDLVLPGTDGIELMKRIRETAEVPVIFLSGHGRDHDMQRALSAGADDYIVKPFAPTELVVRIQAVMRRRAAPDGNWPRKPYQVDSLMINYDDRSVTVAGKPVRLTATEYRLLVDLSINAGRVLTHEQLLHRVWGPNFSGSPDILRSFVRNIRRKLGDDAKNPKYILTEARVGYHMPTPLVNA